jgi:prevent-host-death family protein
MTEEKVVGVYEAKTQLPRLLDSVESGETVTITRHGRPIAKIVPIADKDMTVDEALAEIREFQKSHSLAGIRIKDLINEGRKY